MKRRNISITNDTKYTRNNCLRIDNRYQNCFVDINITDKFYNIFNLLSRGDKKIITFVDFDFLERTNIYSIYQLDLKSGQIFLYKVNNYNLLPFPILVGKIF